MSNPLKLASAFLSELDDSLRAQADRCPECGRPKEGVVRSNQTTDEAGLCVCPESTNQTTEEDQS